ncbi:stemmadenine O-acetyltransferase-like [Prosopis cineraria]|uniref:stemmadenine O-acetyltransferase-like n=1 Tax=Prosopis cineraria TaxID=364024 RepID=UPI00240FF2D7|nr:stemmadenine O-acetyltransferase-like [Prosopis cineraria]
MAEAKIEIVSEITIKPLSPTPNHLKHFNFSLLDEIAFPPSVYLPMVLFYSASDDHDFPKMSQKLKASLSEVLTLYYPLSGRIKGNKSNLFVDCNDEGVLYLEARVPSKLSDFLEKNDNQQLREIKGFLPLDPYTPKQDDEDEDRQVMAVQVSEFGCGGVAIGVCISHKVCDETTVVSFLHAWSQKAMVDHASEVANSSSPLNMEASSIFPPKGIEIDMNAMIDEKNIMTKRFMFSEDNLSRLKEEISRGCSFKPTRVEAVTTLIWKSALEAARTTETTQQSSSFMIHLVNIRSRMVPPLPENSFGNLFVPAFSPLLEVDKEMKMELQDVAEVVRKTIKMVDGDYVSKLQGDGQELVETLESMLQAWFMVAEKGVPFYLFSSWVRFGFYETDFGWGKPTWACTVGVPTRNVIILMPTRSGDGIEAWVSLNELHMLEFENNLLQYASFDP